MKKNDYNGILNDTIKKEIYQLYVEYPFKSFKSLCSFLKEKYDIDIKMGTLSTIMYREYENLANIKNENKNKYMENTRKVLPYNYNDNILSDILKEKCLNLYVKEPYLSLSKISKFLEETHDIEITSTKLNRILRKSYGDIVELKYKNQGVSKKPRNKRVNSILTDEQKKECYDLYTNNPFPTFNEISIILKNKYNIDIDGKKLNHILYSKYPNIADIKNKKRYDELGIPKGRNRKSISILNPEQREECYKLYVDFPFKTYNEIIDFLNETYNIQTKRTTLSSLLNRYYPNMGKERRENIENTRLTEKSYKNDSIGKRQDKIITMIKKGKTSVEISEELGISKTYLSFIKNKLGINKKGRNAIDTNIKIPDDLVKDIKRRWLNGDSFNDIIEFYKNTNKEITYNRIKEIIKSDKSCRKKCKICGNSVDKLNSKLCSDKCRKEYNIIRQKERYKNRTPEQKAKYKENRRQVLIAQGKISKRKVSKEKSDKKKEIENKRKARIEARENLRKYIVKYKLEGLKNKEISEKLNTPEKTIEGHITYLRKNGLL